MNFGITTIINQPSMLNRVSIFSPMNFITSSSFPIAVLLCCAMDSEKALHGSDLFRLLGVRDPVRIRWLGY